MNQSEQSTEDLVILGQVTDKFELLGSVVLQDEMPRRRRLSHDDGRALVTVCAWCDRVRLADAWMETGEAIRRLRTYEDDAPPAFTHTICDSCFEDVRRRRFSGEA